MTIDPRRLDFVRRRLEGLGDQRVTLWPFAAGDPGQAGQIQAIEAKIAELEQELAEGKIR